MNTTTLFLLACFLATAAAFVPTITTTTTMRSKRRDTSLALLDRKCHVRMYHSTRTFIIIISHFISMIENTLLGIGIAVAGLGAGVGLVAFTEAQGERAKQRGSGLSDSMSTRIAGQLLEDVEVSSVQDLSSLTSQLETALRESSGVARAGKNVDVDEYLEMTQEEKEKIAKEADDGW
jgi:hypothetical protein